MYKFFLNGDSIYLNTISAFKYLYEHHFCINKSHYKRFANYIFIWKVRICALYSGIVAMHETADGNWNVKGMITTTQTKIRQILLKLEEI